VPVSAGPVVDVLDEPVGDRVTWTTVNVGEAFPGTPTALSWSWAWWPTEYGIRGAFANLGAISTGELLPPIRLDERAITVQHGHPALNLDLFRRIADATPGSSGDQVERSFFGSVRPGVGGAPRYRRYPVVAARMPVAAVRCRRALLGATTEVDAWWRRSTSPDALDGLAVLADHRAAAALLVEAHRRYARLARPHVTLGLVAQGLYDQVGRLAARAGMAGAEARLVPGGAEESRLVGQLWEVSRGQRGLDRFVAEHGYHGPLESELSSRSWREDAAPLAKLVTAYRDAARAESPVELAARRHREMLAAQRELLAGLGTAWRAPATALLRMARAYLPLREVGRVTFLRSYDVARAAARVFGSRLVELGQLDEPDEVFELSFQEIRQAGAGGVPTARELVAARREQRLAHQRAELPSMWTGRARPAPVAAEPAGALHGIGVSPGVAAGPARVLDSADGDFAEGDILVCRSTDPSWASLFFLAAGVVIDIGGPMSHGAIVARELGIPCVINTTDGTRRLRTGEHVEIDGSTGSVLVRGS
jgi:pyruvate,water dikinase